MQLQKVENNSLNASFYGGKVRLKEIETAKLLRYDEIKKIAEKNNLNISVSKSEKMSKFFSGRDVYTVLATKRIGYSALLGIGTTLTAIKKHISAEELS